MNRLEKAILFINKLIDLLRNSNISNSKGRKATIYETKLTKFYDIEEAPVICVIKENISGSLENPDQLFLQVPNVLNFIIQVADFSDISLIDADKELDYLFNQVIEILLNNLTEFSDLVFGISIEKIDFDELKTDSGVFWSIGTINLVANLT